MWLYIYFTYTSSCSTSSSYMQYFHSHHPLIIVIIHHYHHQSESSPSSPPPSSSSSPSAPEHLVVLVKQSQNLGAYVSYRTTLDFQSILVVFYWRRQGWWPMAIGHRKANANTNTHVHKCHPVASCLSHLSKCGTVDLDCSLFLPVLNPIPAAVAS